MIGFSSKHDKSIILFGSDLRIVDNCNFFPIDTPVLGMKIDGSLCSGILKGITKNVVGDFFNIKLKNEKDFLTQTILVSAALYCGPVFINEKVIMYVDQKAVEYNLKNVTSNQWCTIFIDDGLKDVSSQLVFRQLKIFR